MAHRVASGLSRYALPVAVGLSVLLTLLAWTNPSQFGPGSLHTVYMAEGGVLALALLLTLFAIINRQWLYILFAVWLIGNLRITAMTMGWDIIWLGQIVPAAQLPFIRALTASTYYILTWQLFVCLFPVELARIDHPRIQRVGLWIGLLLFAAAFLLPYPQFVIAGWVLSATGIAIALFLAVRIVRLTRGHLVIWYSAALLMVLAAGIGLPELIGTPVGNTLLKGTYAHVSVTLVSSALIAFVIAQQERNERRQRLQAQADIQRVYDVTPVGLFTLDANGVFVRANPALRSILGLNVPFDKTVTWTHCFGATAWDRTAQLADNEQGGEIEIRRFAVGSVVAQTFLVRAIRIEQRIKGSLEDITERVETITQLRIQANHDPLTNTLNQRGLEDSLRQALNGMMMGEPLAIGHLNLSSLNSFRELYGYEASDAALKALCERISTVLTGSQSLGRLNDTEFIIVFSDTTIEQARDLATKIIDVLHTDSSGTGVRPPVVKAFMGLVEIVDVDTDPQAAILVAGRACRTAQRNNSGPLLVYEHMQTLLTERSQELKLMRDFSKGFSPEGLHLAMQPILPMASPLDYFNLEVLLRMQDENGLPVPTPKLIAIAEESGVIPTIDKWVFTTALEWFNAHYERLPLLRNIGLNLNGVSLNDPNFIDELFVILGRYPHLTGRLTVEITEGVALHNIDDARRLTFRLQALGVRVALDDFGAGYTSFTYLKSLPANALKVDGAFIQNMTRHPADAAIIAAIITLARNMGMQVVAEWVKDEATFRALAQLGVDYVQGYAISGALTPDEILRTTSVSDLIKTPAIRAYVVNELAGGIAYGPPSSTAHRKSAAPTRTY